MNLIRPALMSAAAALALLAVSPAPLTAQTATPVVTILLAADGSQGGVPYNGVIQASDGNLYGANQCAGYSECITASGLGPSSLGNIFEITPAGVYSVVYSFGGGDNGSIPQGLVQAPDGYLYGVTVWQGANGYGTVFRFNIATHALTTLYAFTGTAGQDNPLGTVIYGNDGYLYGTTAEFANSTGEGVLWRIKTDGTGFQSLWQFGASGGADASTFGTYPQDGVTKVGANLYGTSQNGGPDGVGAVWYVNTSGQGVVLHDFTEASDGGYPPAAPKYYSDGFLYGTTLECDGNNHTYYGSVYKIGPTAGFTSEFATQTPGCLDGRIGFDGRGNGFFGSRSTGDPAGGGLWNFLPKTDAASQIYTLPADMSEGLQLISEPFLDNRGRIWTEQYDDGSDANPGSILAFTLSPAETSPITITSSLPTVAPNTDITISWQSLNAFSSNEQVCFATQSPQNAGAGTAWSGLQTGTYANGVLSGSKGSISFPATGDYLMSITCGGKETALLTEHVRDASKTTVTVSPSTVTEGNTVTFTASVSGNGTGATGIVTLTSSFGTIGTIDLSKTTTLAFTATGVSPGTYTITANYAGDIQYDPSSGTTSLVVTAGSGPVATTTAFTANPNPVGSGNNITFTATVKKSSGTGVPTGNVTFSAGGMALATVALNSSGVATLTAPSTGYPKGTYPVIATYNGDANDKSSTSPTVNVSIETATTTGLTASPNPVAAGGNVTLTATISAGTATGSVKFMTGTTLLATVGVSGGKAVLTAPTTGYPAGTYPLYAIYSGDSNNAGSTSPTVNVTLK